jgi:phosphate ABC transporter phosphate-binding protein
MNPLKGNAMRFLDFRAYRRVIGHAIAAVLAGALVVTAAPAASGATYVPISGAGSTWSYNALDQWRKNVDQYGIKVNFGANGSSDGRNQFRNGTVDFAVSEIPYGLKDGNVVDQPPARKHAYMPIVAGGTAIMYNLKIGSKQVTNLRLSGATIAGMFTGTIKSWDDPAVKADNPGLTLPARRVVPVVRSDGSGTTAQFTSWMAAKQGSQWNAYCGRAGRSSSSCGITSNYPTVGGSGFIAQSGSNGVSGYVSQPQNIGAITYVEYSYALNSGFPVAKVLNESGYYVEPTPSNTAVGLLGARINNNEQSAGYLTADLSNVYNNKDRRAYPLSSYSYMVLPTAIEGTLTAKKGNTLGEFAYYFLCEGQQQAPRLGYSPLPINLVEAGLEQVRRIPGVTAQKIDIKKCNNPTFSASGENTLAKNAPQPQACDKKGPTQCATGTGGAAKTSTPVKSDGGRGGGSDGGTGTGPGGTAAPGTAGADGAAGGTTVDGAVPEGAVIDPDTGEVITAAGAGGAVGVDAVAVSLAADAGGGVQRAAMVVAALMVLALMFAPPLVARGLARRRES